jgi:NADPH:quinone reductase-like Zn-dependent oxidoreductase
MKAAFIDRYGSNDVVRVGDLAVPTMGDADLLVRVHAASVNPVDIKTRDGKLKTLLKNVPPWCWAMISQAWCPTWAHG